MKMSKKLNEYTINRKLNSKLPEVVDRLDAVVEEIMSVGEKEGVMPIGELGRILIAGETLTYFSKSYKKIASK